MDLSIEQRQTLLAAYVVVSSYRKMHERITHRYSQPYMAGLLVIADSLSMANYQRWEPLTLTSRDRTFLMSIQQIVLNSSHDASRCKKIDCKFNCEYRLLLPELCRIAEMAKTSTETPMFYTEATLVEYHRLLVNLLEHFKFHLCVLVNDAKRWKDGYHSFNMVRFFGSTLHNMLSSEIMRQHMRNIEQSLCEAMDEKPEKAGQKAAKVDGAATKGKSKGSGSSSKSWPWNLKATKERAAEAGDGGEREGAGAEIEEDEFDDIIASVQIRATEYKCSNHEIGSTVILRCYLWLRLMTTYFDAMDQLLPSGSTSPRLPKNTTVKTLAVKYQGKERMDWETVCLKHLPDSETIPNYQLVAKFKEYLKGDKWLNSWFGDEGTFLDNNFSGTRHCEAIASVLIFLQSQGSIEPLLPVCYPCDIFIAVPNTCIHRSWKSCLASPKDAAQFAHSSFDIWVASLYEAHTNQSLPARCLRGSQNVMWRLCWENLQRGCERL